MGVTSIGISAFQGNALSSVIIPRSVVYIGDGAFNTLPVLVGENTLKQVYFQGNAPSIGSAVFVGKNPTAYHLPGTTGWVDFATDSGLPTALWLLPKPTILDFEPNFGVQTNRFGFTISWATNKHVVVEGCTNLVKRNWSPVATNTLTAGVSYFSDSHWTNHPSRFYRLRSP